MADDFQVQTLKFGYSETEGKPQGATPPPGPATPAGASPGPPPAPGASPAPAAPAPQAAGAPGLGDPRPETPGRIVFDVEPLDHGRRWRAIYQGEVLGEWRAPFFAAARALLAKGLDPQAVLAMRHRPGPASPPGASGVIGLTGRLGEAAGWYADDKAMAFKPWSAPPSTRRGA